VTIQKYQLANTDEDTSLSQPSQSQDECDSLNRSQLPNSVLSWLPLLQQLGTDGTARAIGQARNRKAFSTAVVSLFRQMITEECAEQTEVNDAASYLNVVTHVHRNISQLTDAARPQGVTKASWQSCRSLIRAAFVTPVALLYVPNLRWLRSNTNEYARILAHVHFAALRGSPHTYCVRYRDQLKQLLFPESPHKEWLDEILQYDSPFGNSSYALLRFPIVPTSLSPQAVSEESYRQLKNHIDGDDLYIDNVHYRLYVADAPENMSAHGVEWDSGESKGEKQAWEDSISALHNLLKGAPAQSKVFAVIRDISYGRRVAELLVVHKDEDDALSFINIVDTLIANGSHVVNHKSLTRGTSECTYYKTLEGFAKAQRKGVWVNSPFIDPQEQRDRITTHKKARSQTNK
jgi:hypothetical protein